MTSVPIGRPEEVEAFLNRLPVAVNRSEFTELVKGFPRRYMESTPAAEVVRHYALIRSLGARPVVSSLSRVPGGWRICIVARDRHFLFARIAGSLSCSGLGIVGAEAFANSSDVVLDRFDCVDLEGGFEDAEVPRRFQVFLEGVVRGETDLDPLLRKRLPRLKLPSGTLIASSWADDAHPIATRLLVRATDCFGFLYLVSRALSLAGCNIEQAEIATTDGRAVDAFYLTVEGRPLDERDKAEVDKALAGLVERDDEPEGWEPSAEGNLVRLPRQLTRPHVHSAPNAQGPARLLRPVESFRK